MYDIIAPITNENIMVMIYMKKKIISENNGVMAWK